MQGGDAQNPPVQQNEQRPPLQIRRIFRKPAWYFILIGGASVLIIVLAVLAIFVMKQHEEKS